jgi:hypothetical protein
MATDTIVQPANTNSEEGQALLQANSFLPQAFGILKKLRGVPLDVLQTEISPRSTSTASYNIAEALSALSSALTRISRPREAGAIDQILEKAVDKKAFGGLVLSRSKPATPSDYEEALFLTEAWLESLNSQEKAATQLSTIDVRSAETKPMNLAQKIFARHTIGGCTIEGLAIGDLIRVRMDWVIASERKPEMKDPSPFESIVNASERAWRGHMQNWAPLKYGGATASGLPVTTSCTPLS